MTTSNTDHDETLKKQIQQVLKDTHCWVTDECGKNAVEAIQSLINEARIDELKQLWNSTQPDIVPEGVEANDMSEELHKRIEKLRSES